MADTKTITHELLDNAGGKLSLVGSDIKVAAALTEGSLTARLRTTVVMEYDKMITVSAPPAPSVLIPSGNLVALIGDSRSASSETIATAGTSRYLNVAGIEAHLSALLGGRIRFVPVPGAIPPSPYGTAIGGSTVGDGDANGIGMTSRLPAAIASGAKAFLVLTGVNGGAYSVADQIAFHRAAIVAARDAGILYILISEIPNGHEADANTAYHLDLHAQLQALEGQYSNLVVINAFDRMLKPGTVNSLRDAETIDSLHLEVPGNVRLAKILYDDYFLTAFAGFAKAADINGAADNTVNLNPLLNTTGGNGSISAGGGTINGGATAVPRYYTAQGVNLNGVTVNISLAAGTRGNKFKMVGSGTPTLANPAFSLLQNVAVTNAAFLAAATPGKKYRLTCYVKVAAGGTIRTVRPQLFFSKSGGTPSSLTLASMHNNNGRAAQMWPTDAYEGQIVSEVLEVPAGWTGGLTGAQASVGIGLVQNEYTNFDVEVSEFGIIEVTQ